MGGIGKTGLAIVLAHTWRDRFPDAQIWLDGRGIHADAPSAGRLLEQVLQAFHPTAKLPEDLATLQGLYQQELHDNRVLVVVDNAKDAAQVKPLMPPTGSGLLVTSRHNFLIGTTPPFPLGKLSTPAAVQLLQQFVPTLTDSDSQALATACAGLPLALKLAGAHLALDASERAGVPDVAGYLHQLRSGRLATLDADAPELDEVTISETFRLSAAQLTDEERTLWLSLGVFASSFNASAATALSIRERQSPESDSAATTALLDRLVRRSLLDRAGDRRYEMHDLAAEYARNQLLPATLTATYLAHARHYARVGAETNKLYLAGDAVGGLALFDQDRSQLEAAFGWLIGSADPERDQVLLDLINGIVYTSNLRIHPRQRITWLEAQLAAARRVDNRADEGSALGNLGLAYADLGEPRRAIEFYEQALVISREIGDRRGEGAALGNLGLAYRNLGEPRRAIEFYEQHLTIAREINDRRGEGNALGNLGLAYTDLGEPRRAIEFHEQALLISREIGDRRGEGTDLGNLGRAYADLGEPRRAIEFYEQYLTIAREIGDRRGEANALYNSALSLWKLNEPSAAIQRAELALEIYTAIESPVAAKVQQKLAAWQQEAAE